MAKDTGQQNHVTMNQREVLDRHQDRQKIWNKCNTAKKKETGRTKIIKYIYLPDFLSIWMMKNCSIFTTSTQNKGFMTSISSKITQRKKREEKRRERRSKKGRAIPRIPIF